MLTLVKKILRKCKKFKKLIQIVFFPLILIPLAIFGQSIGKCGYVIALMILYWVFECFPIGITSLIPLVLYPVFGIMKSREVSMIYFSNNVMFIFASLVISLSIRTTKLHEKLALKICMIIGSDPKWLLLGIMSSTAFLSLWVSNTTTTSMILPIAMSIAREIIKLDPRYHGKEKKPSISCIEMTSNTSSLSPVENLNEAESNDDFIKTNEARNLSKAFGFSVAYSSVIGGFGTLIGANSNIVLKDFIDKMYSNSNFNFFTFMLFSIPICIILLLSSWFTLCLLWLPKGTFVNFLKKHSDSNYVHRSIKEKYENLGPYTWGQISVSFWFIIAILLWITRDLYFVPGWEAIFKEKFVTDTSTAVAILIIICAWPKKNPLKNNDDYEPLLSWKDIEKHFQWKLILLLGGSIAMAKGCEVSGFSEWFGNALKSVLPSNKILLFLIITIFSTIGTEFISNVAMASIMLPILSTIATTYNISHYYLLISQSIAVNFSYMIPAATPSNALNFAEGQIRIKDMLLTGSIIKMLAIATLFAASNLWLEPIFV